MRDSDLPMELGGKASCEPPGRVQITTLAGSIGKRLETITS